MKPVTRAGLRAPARIVDIDVADQSGRSIEVAGYRSLWCLYRADGIPQAIGMWDVADDDTVLVPDPSAPLAGGGISPRLLSAPEGRITVVICTRDRPEGLARLLDSLRKQDDADFDVLVVDNAPAHGGVEREVLNSGLPRSRYVLETQPGLSWARNRGLAEVETEFAAWLDDDETADPTWMRWVKRGFGHPSAPDAISGLMLPAVLETEAQALFEQYGGFNKGRGFEPEVLAAGTPTVRSPLYPIPGFGAGGNMAFRVEPVRRLGGFDTRLGAGTRTHGGEETQVLARLLLRGGRILHWPPALTWHTHRRTVAELENQFFGYSAGLSAFYISMIRAEPRSLLAIAKLVPQGVADLLRQRGQGREGELADDFPVQLLQASRRGILQGAFLYGRQALADRGRLASARTS